MKKYLSFLALALVLILACAQFNLPTQVEQPTIETIVAATMQAMAATIPGPQAGETPVGAPTESAFTGTPVKFNQVSLTIPPGLAVGASGVQFAPASGDDIPYWEITPGHSELTLSGYALSDKFHEPRIYIYPAREYAALMPGAAENILFLQTILANPNAPLRSDKNLFIPFFNAGAVFTAQPQVIQFQNGAGVRMLTQYAQSYATANNHELFYHFQGLTNDGQTYIIAILPESAPFLAANSQATTPPDGIPFPGYEDPNADFEAYYRQVIDRLNSTPAEAFAPSLSALDALIKSLRIENQ